MHERDTTVVILCGGQGTRAYPQTLTIPKALMQVGELPIVEHVMRIYAGFGYRNFVLSVGHLKEEIIDYFDARKRHLPWSVTCVDTGASTETGGRILGCRDYVTDTFHATYCDGLGDVDLNALVRFHREHGGHATMTSVALRSQYGIVNFRDNGQITDFEEKPIIHDRWINAGFFVFERSVFDCWQGENLERDVLPNLAAREQLFLYQHRGFWKSMDTHKDQLELTQAWEPYTRSKARNGDDSELEAARAAGLTR